MTATTEKTAYYSLTAFAKQLDISAPTLSQVILGKRPLTRKTALKIIDRCSFTPDQRNYFLSSILNFKSPLAFQGTSAGQTYQDLEPEVFQMISKWHHYAILSLGDIKPNFADSKWISERLGITEREASEAFDRLLKLNLIEIRQASFSQVSSPLWMPTAQPSANAIRQSHLQNLKKAELALYDDTTKLELYSTLTVAANERFLPEVRLAIGKFRQSIREMVDRGSRGRVYTLAVQMFPVSKP
ncbi:MAG: TIGR02147 family protein [Proteobacteria bacterium]|nr:TIGR02147 family protein [Pseudomonadota bacterium]